MYSFNSDGSFTIWRAGQQVRPLPLFIQSAAKKVNRSKVLPGL
jgi:hypothetical protein